MQVPAEDQILSGSAPGERTYAFNDRHDERLPADLWFQTSDEGRILFLVFYTRACRWSRCIGCGLPALMSRRHIDAHALRAQIDHVFSRLEVQRERTAIRKVIVSNNGSVLDPETFSPAALKYLMAQLNVHLPNLAVLCLETRPEYVEVEELELLDRALQEGQSPIDLELAIGFEVFDDHIRNDIFQKGLGLDAFERLAAKMARYSYRLKCYFMQKPVPGMTDDEAVRDIERAIDYLDGVAVKHDLRINLHLNPTYVPRGTRLEESFRRGEYQPPRLQDVARAAWHARGKRITVYLGLYDEGLAVPGGSFLRPGEDAVLARLAAFNQTEDYSLLAGL